MAIFKPSSIVGAISGNIGGGCFVNGRGSKVVRKTKQPTTNYNTETLQAQANYATVLRRWRTFTVDEQNAWTVYANANPTTNRLGEKSPLSGFQIFMKIQLTMFTQLPFWGPNPPTLANQPNIHNLTFESTVSGGITIDIDTAPVVEFVQIQIDGHLLQTDSLPKFWGRFKFIFILNILASGGAFDMSSQWQDKFPLPILGQVVALRGRFVTNDHARFGNFQQIIKTSA